MAQGESIRRERRNALKNRAMADALAAAGFEREAAKHREEADLSDAYADLCNELEDMRDRHIRGEVDKATWKAKQRDVHEMRRLWRLYGEAAGTRGGAKVVNNDGSVAGEG